MLPCLAFSELLYIFGSVLVFHLTPNQLQLPWLGSLSLSGFFLIPTPQPYESIYRLSDLQPGSAQVLLSLFWFILFFPERLPFLPLIYKGQPTISPPSSSFTAASLPSGFVSQLLSEPICGSQSVQWCVDIFLIMHKVWDKIRGHQYSTIFKLGERTFFLKKKGSYKIKRTQTGTKGSHP